MSRSALIDEKFDDTNVTRRNSFDQVVPVRVMSEMDLTGEEHLTKKERVSVLIRF